MNHRQNGGSYKIFLLTVRKAFVCFMLSGADTAQPDMNVDKTFKQSSITVYVRFRFCYSIFRHIPIVDMHHDFPFVLLQRISNYLLFYSLCDMKCFFTVNEGCGNVTVCVLAQPVNAERKRFVRTCFHSYL